MTSQAQVPIQLSVGAALRFVVEQWRPIATVSAIGALITALLGAATLAAPLVGLFAPILTSIVQAIVYTFFIAGFLGLGSEKLAMRGLRLWSAMAVIGFLLVIVFFVLSLPVSMLLLAGPMAPYSGDLQAAGADEAAVMAVMLRFMQEQPVAIGVTLLFFSAVWMFLTSRLYLAAPATADQGRVLTFETWAWTKGSTLRIIAARLLLLAPAYALVTALAYLIAGLFGINALDPQSVNAAAQSNFALFVIYIALRTFLTLAIYSALEAGLSAYLYQGLKPAAAEQAPA